MSAPLSRQFWAAILVAVLQIVVLIVVTFDRWADAVMLLEIFLYVTWMFIVFGKDRKS